MSLHAQIITASDVCRCMNPERGLPAPDVVPLRCTGSRVPDAAVLWQVLYMSVPADEAQKRSEFGQVPSCRDRTSEPLLCLQERYEKKEMQEKVSKIFQQLRNDKWKVNS